MTSLLTPSRPTAADRPDDGDGPRVRWRDLVAAEWIKLWSLRSTRWVLSLGMLILLGLALQSSLDTYDSWPDYGPVQRSHYDPVTEALSGAGVALLMIGAGTVGALSIVGEYASGLIRATLTAVPARHRVVLAKAVVLTGVMCGVGAFVSLGTFTLSQAVLSGRGIGLSVSDPGVPGVLAANAALAPVSALVGLGIGALLRHTAMSVVTTCGLLVVLPGFFKPTVHQWANELFGYFPYYAWRGTLSQLHPRTGDALPTAAEAWAGFGLWPVLAVILAVLIVRRRDV
ncbi:ABC transporter permease subunit [Streptomyces sp. NBC_01565]|uniref:ABC transporter permease subunit n=1 Tax=Streptomyces sp. NBC_01565 TaxID=2975881 RepID=UPI00224C92FA|nr:ABC transporter permease subunit [Streptomyces sp. NBC_01565]MCX4546461.1 ABC transporter permease [Streptomyces sp. NBC_01565]